MWGKHVPPILICASTPTGKVPDFSSPIRCLHFHKSLNNKKQTNKQTNKKVDSDWLRLKYIWLWLSLYRHILSKLSVSCNELNFSNFSHQNPKAYVSLILVKLIDEWMNELLMKISFAFNTLPLTEWIHHSVLTLLLPSLLLSSLAACWATAAVWVTSSSSWII